MKTFVSKTVKVYDHASENINYLQHLGLLAARIYVAWVFFSAGLTKIRDWETTLWLFEEEYSVPLLNYQLAAVLGTVGELVLPIILIFGFATRFGALGLFVVNIVAVISLEEIAPAAYILHVLWGVLLAQITVFGAGALSFDFILRKNLINHL